MTEHTTGDWTHHPTLASASMSLFANDSRGACARRRGDCRHTLDTRARRALTSQRADALRAQHHVLHKRTNGARRRRKWAISVLAEHSRPEHARAISWPSVGANGTTDSALHSHGGIQRLWRVGTAKLGVATVNHTTDGPRERSPLRSDGRRRELELTPGTRSAHDPRQDTHTRQRRDKHGGCRSKSREWARQ